MAGPVSTATAVDAGTRAEARPRSWSVIGAWVLFTLLAASLASLALRSPDRVTDVPLVEDAFYALSAARNVAEGSGPTIDGEELTNGFQPLFTFVEVVPFLTGDETTALRLVLLIQAVATTAAALLLGSVVRAAAAPRSRLVVPLVGVLYLSASFVTRASLSGLETGFLLLMYVLWWRAYQRRGLSSTTDAVVLGVVAGLTVLARIDAVFVLGLFALATWWLADDRAAGFRRSVLMGVVAVAVSGPWWVYNVLGFGSPVPTSGAAQQDVDLVLGRYDDLLGALAQPLLPWLAFPTRWVQYRVLALIPAALALFVWWRWLRGTVPAEDPADPVEPEVRRRTDVFAAVLVAAALSLGAWYVVTSWAEHFYGRYLSLLVLPALYLWARFCLLALRRWPRLTSAGVATLALVGLLSTLSYWGGSLGDGNTYLQDQVALVERTVPDDEVVAAGQSGTLGFFRDDVLNLDGKVNTDAYEQRDDIVGYLDEQQVEWLCDWQQYVEGYLGDPATAGWDLVDEEGAFRCYHRELPGVGAPG